MILGYVAWFYALEYCKIIIMVTIIMYDLTYLSVITIILIIILDNILPTYVIHYF